MVRLRQGLEDGQTARRAEVRLVEELRRSSGVVARKAPADFGWSERLGLRRPRYNASASHASPNLIYPLINVSPIGSGLSLLC